MFLYLVLLSPEEIWIVTGRKSSPLNYPFKKIIMKIRYNIQSKMVHFKPVLYLQAKFTLLLYDHPRQRYIASLLKKLCNKHRIMQEKSMQIYWVL